jgi:hypothetical protein
LDESEGVSEKLLVPVIQNYANWSIRAAMKRFNRKSVPYG